MGYREILETLRGEILEGKYDVAKTLPSEFALARRFKVCRPTVSRAMQELSSAGLVVRCKGAATRLTRFARNASGCMGLVIQGRWTEGDLFPRIGRQITSIAERSGWRVLRCEIMETSRRGRLHEIRDIVERLTAEHVTGVYFQPVECMSNADTINVDIVARFKRAGIHVVLLDYDVVHMPRRSQFDVVSTDNYMAGYELGSLLVERGSKRLAFFYRPNAAPSVVERLQGVAAAIGEHGGKNSCKLAMETIDPSDVKGIAAFCKRFRPNAVVAHNDDAAIRLCASLRQIGYRIPKDITVAGFDDIPAVATNDLPIMTMRQDVAGLAELAFHAMVTRIRNPDLPPRKILLPGELVVRDSSRSKSS